MSNPKEKRSDQEKRINSLIQTASKLSLQSAEACRKAFAAAIYFACQHGEIRYVNELFNNLQPGDQHAMRAFGLYRLHDIFGTDGERDPQDSTRWLKRPTAIISYRANPPKEQAGEHFRLVKLSGEEAELEGEALKAAKATKKAITDAGEEALAFEWITPDMARAAPSPFEYSTFAKRLENLLVQAAKNAYRMGNHLDARAIRQLAKVGGLEQGAFKKITEAMVTEAPSAANESEQPAEENMPEEQEAA